MTTNQFPPRISRATCRSQHIAEQWASPQYRVRRGNRLPESSGPMKQRLVTLLALVGINQHLSAEQRHDLANAAMQTAPGAAAWRTEQEGRILGRIFRPLIDFLARPWGRDHCRTAFESERLQRHLPKEYRP